MARIKGRNRADTQRAVLCAAEWAFARFGFRGASMQVIAKQAQVTPATLCYYFSDKAGLYQGVVDAIYERAGSLTGALQPNATIEELIILVYEFAEANRDALRVILGQIAEDGGLDVTTREVRMTRSLDLIVPIVAARFQVDKQCARGALVSLNHLIMRFVTNTPEDNRVALGVSSDAEARIQILALLTSIARHLLRLPPQQGESYDPRH